MESIDWDNAALEYLRDYQQWLREEMTRINLLLVNYLIRDRKTEESNDSVEIVEGKTTGYSE